MKLHHNGLITFFSLLFILILVTIGCSPRYKSLGLPQREYRYQIPEKIADGWETSSLEEEGVNSEKIVGLIEDILVGKFKNIHSVLLVTNGKIILEEYFYGYDRDTTHEMASATKSVTSILVGIAIDQNRLSGLDMMVYDFFPEYKGTKWIDQRYEINLKHLLSMSAGLGWHQWSFPLDDFWERKFFDSNIISPPGEKFAYNGMLTHLLGEIVRKSTGMETVKFAEENLFTPLGIFEYTWDGPPWAFGLSLKPRDMAKIGYLFLRKGKLDGKQIVSPEWVSESTKSHVKAIYAGSGYGYQWWHGKTVISNQTIDTYYAAGMGGQYIFVIPKLDLVSVFTSQVNNPEGIYRPHVMMTEYVIPAILPQSVPPKTIKLDPTILKQYVGEYYFKMWDVKVSVINDADKIYYIAFDGEKVELSPLTEYQFHGTHQNHGEIKINFHKNEEGEVTKLERIIGFAYLPFDKVK